MNETAKAALLDARASMRSEVANAEHALMLAKSRAAGVQARLESAHNDLADLDAALTEAGVDLAAEDAKAAERASVNPWRANSGQSVSDLGGTYGRDAQNVRALNQSDAALARAFDEA